MSRCPRCHKRFRLFGKRRYGGTLYSDDALTYGRMTCHRCPGSYLPNGELVPPSYFYDHFVMDTSQGYNMLRRKTDAERAQP